MKDLQERGLGVGVLGGFRVQGAEDFHSSHPGRGTTRAETAQGTPTQSQMSPTILVYEEKLVSSQGWKKCMVKPIKMRILKPYYEMKMRITKAVASGSACFRDLGFGIRVSGFGFRVSGFGFRVSVFGFQVSGFGFRVSDFGFRVSGFGFRAAGLRFQVSGFEFRFSVFGVRV